MPKLILLPTGPGSLTELSPEGAATNYECVDEPVLNDDTDFVYNGTLGTSKRDLYKVNPSSLADDVVINSVTLIANLKKVGGASSNGTLLVKDAGKVKTLGAIIVPTQVSYNTEAKWVLPARPYGGVWTKAALAEIEIGLKLNCSSFTDSEIRCSKLRLEVDHN